MQSQSQSGTALARPEVVKPKFRTRESWASRCAMRWLACCDRDNCDRDVLDDAAGPLRIVDCPLSLPAKDPVCDSDDKGGLYTDWLPVCENFSSLATAPRLTCSPSRQRIAGQAPLKWVLPLRSWSLFRVSLATHPPLITTRPLLSATELGHSSSAIIMGYVTRRPKQHLVRPGY